MENQEFPMLVSQLPKKWQPKYLLKRIGEEDLVITKETRDEIVKELRCEGKFIQLGEHIIIFSQLRGIDPYWGSRNIPPRPLPQQAYEYDREKNTNYVRITNQAELDEWDKFFGKEVDDVLR